MNYWQPAIVAFLSNYLPAYKAADIYVPIRHYICREPSTNQPFLCKTNPILSAVGGLQMNVYPYNTTDYENKSNRTLGENKPNSNPIAERVKLMQSVYLQRNMKKNAAKGYEKTKPKQTQSNPISNRAKNSWPKAELQI
jgi:hypothetical protein